MFARIPILRIHKFFHKVTAPKKENMTFFREKNRAFVDSVN